MKILRNKTYSDSDNETPKKVGEAIGTALVGTAGTVGATDLIKRGAKKYITSQESKKAQKAVESSNRNADQASQQVKNISKTRKSVATNPGGLEIKNQGAGDITVKKEGGNVTAHKIASKKSGQTTTTVRTTSTKPDVVVDKMTSKGSKKVSTEAVKKSAEKTQKVAEVAQKTTKDSKKILNGAKKLMNTKAGKIAGGVALASGAMIGAKKLYDHKKK